MLEKLLARAPGKTQKDLASEAGISYPTLNAWMNRTRGPSRIDPEKLRAMVEVFRRWGVRTTPKEFFEAVGRPVPGPSGDEREAWLLKLKDAEANMPKAFTIPTAVGTIRPPLASRSGSRRTVVHPWGDSCVHPHFIDGRSAEDRGVGSGRGQHPRGQRTPGTRRTP
ncbi:helix-turn-helix transcriptional regulator [Streptomyces sp. NPDC051001]|uniref:helix-turn-helix domain-containing protein n=1 Tax=Streptomyces sp. NPDC051001 TaxID=3155795 RepID=UPI00342549E8